MKTRRTPPPTTPKTRKLVVLEEWLPSLINWPHRLVVQDDGSLAVVFLSMFGGWRPCKDPRHIPRFR